jgi:adenylosuccinate synthase
VLDGFDEIKVATGYELGGKLSREWPGALTNLADAVPHYESARGWKHDITGVREYADLPPLARKYVEWLEKLVGVPIVMLSVGPDRDQIIPRRGAPIAALV